MKLTGAILDVWETNWALPYHWLTLNSLQLHQEVCRKKKMGWWKEVLEVEKEDPVRGRREVPKTKKRVV